MQEERRKSAADQIAEKGIDLTLSSSGVGVAEVLSINATPEQEAKVLRKIDLYLMPLMGFCYMLQFMDKVSLGYSTQLGLIKDLKLVGTEYAWTSSIFYFGYLFWSWPSSYFSVRFPLAKYLSVTVLVWGAVLMCHGATTNFTTLLIARFFLGVTEAAVAPGFSLLTGMFYKRNEQPSRMGIWFAGNGIANIVSGVVAYGIGNITTSIATWRLLFLILGAVTAAYGFVLLFFLPDSISRAKFLNLEEKEIALHRVLENKTGLMDEGNFKTGQMVEALKDPQAWCLFLYQLSVNIPNGGVTTFNSIIVAGFGFSPLNSLLLQMPAGVVQLLALAFVCVVATYVKNVRLVLMIFMVTLSVVGMTLVYTVPNTHPYGRLVGVWLTAPFAVNIPMSLSLVTSNVGGFTKRATISAMLFVGYCAGNIIGPQFFYTSEAPSYPTGIKAVLSGLALGIFFLACLLAFYIFENRRRDGKFGSSSDLDKAEDLAEDISNLTDRQIKGFRYTL